MRLVVHQIAVKLDYTETAVLAELARKLRCRSDLVRDVLITRRSLDARPRNPEPRYVLSAEVSVDDDAVPAPLPPDVVPAAPPVAAQTSAANRAAWTGNGADRPLVVGCGPAGLLAAHVLAQAGARPILIDRGDDAATRADRVAAFWRDGTLDTESNALFGEGGAGLFSDGKLTARTKDQVRCRRFLESLVACGAAPEILVDAEPHIGSDRLLEILPRLHEQIREQGGEVRFGARLEQLVVEHGRLRAAVVNGTEIPCSACVLAVGHSARDVYSMLNSVGVALAPRQFAVGVRLELPQAAVDRAQYGRFADDPRLGAASFRLTRRPAGHARACYSFCMCPGGLVIACASEPGFLTTNGMSCSRRNLPYANAAFLVPVGPDDYPATDKNAALAGIAFQRAIEARAFAAGGGAYGLPAIRLTDFLARRQPAPLPDGRSCPRATAADPAAVLPGFVIHTLRIAIPKMLKELNGVTHSDALLYAAETRSSSPVRIERNEQGESTSLHGLFPAGEGAGYAGGIVSSAIDGIRAAEAVLNHSGASHS